MGTLCYPPSFVLLLPCIFTWTVLAKGNVTQEVHPWRARGSGGLGAPQALSHADSLSFQPDWALHPCTTSCSELKKKKKKFVVQFECVLICLPSIAACALSESGAEFLGHQLFTACF